LEHGKNIEWSWLL